MEGSARAVAHVRTTARSRGSPNVRLEREVGIPMESYERDGLHFDVTDLGPADGEVVILLHGFPADRHCWDDVGARLADAGYRVLAPDQRGYSPGACPAGRRSYRVGLLAGDVIALADAAGAARFHVVGHDWGAGVAWHLAGTAPGRVASLSAVSVPHPRAMLRALIHSSQALHSWYMLAFQLPAIPERVLAAGGGARLRRSLRSSGLGARPADRYAARAARPGAMTGPVNWYRAIPWAGGGGDHPVTVPTVMIWGPGDSFVSRVAAEGAAAWVDADYRFVEVPGGTHWLPEGDPDAVTGAVTAHLAAHPA
jgi:pimeloyl-ACP methyl ester carboxylesterase